MGYEKVIHSHYTDLNNLSSLLRNYIEIYRLLVSSTAELNSTSITKKTELKHAVERIDSIGDIIDDILKVIKKCEMSYGKYCSLKSEVILAKTEKETILTEIHDELEYHN
jgi:hypothetical protein